MSFEAHAGAAWRLVRCHIMVVMRLLTRHLLPSPSIIAFLGDATTYEVTFTGSNGYVATLMHQICGCQITKGWKT